MENASTTADTERRTAQKSQRKRWQTSRSRCKAAIRREVPPSWGSMTGVLAAVQEALLYLVATSVVSSQISFRHRLPPRDAPAAVWAAAGLSRRSQPSR